MNSFIKPENWEPVDGIYYAQDSVENEVIKESGNFLVTAGPGAGKTELLAQKATYLLETNTCKNPKKILAISFKVDAADNIEKRVESRCGKELSKRFISKTYDSFFKGLLDQYIYLLPEEYRPVKDYNIIQKGDIDKYLSRCISDWDNLNYDAKNFYRKECLTQFQIPVADSEYGEFLKIIWGLMLKGDGELDAKLTFEMIGRLVQLIIKENPVIKKVFQLTYDYIFLDEFQDTTDVQYDVIKELFNGTSTKVIAVGDNKQRIMKWAGAKDNIFSIFSTDFNAVSKKLLVNHRSAPDILKLESVVASEIEGEKVVFEVDKKWGSNKGTVKVDFFENEDEEAKMVSMKVRELLNNNIQPRDICIVIRAKPQEYCFKLLETLRTNKIKARYEDKYQNLLREKIVQLIIDIFKVSLESPRPEEFTRINNFIRDNNDIKNIENLFENTRNKLCGTNSKDGLKDIVTNIIEFLGIDFIKASYPQYKRGNYLYNTIGDFIDLFFESYSNLKDWNSALDDFMGVGSIPIMSIHKSKGLEFNTVFFIGIDKALFFRYKKSKDEELCTFFVGISRAKENLYITSTKIRENFKYKTTYVNDFYNMIKNSGVLKDCNDK